MQPADTLATIDDLSRTAGRCELINGEIVVISPAGEHHGWVAGTIHTIVGGFVRRNRLGRVYSAETGFILSRDPDTVRAPDVGFADHHRLRAAVRGFGEFVPNLIVEVVSPDDRWSQVEAKARMWLDHGADAVWIADPENREIHVCALGGRVQILTTRDTLDGGTVLPGFSVAVAEFFAE